MYFALYDYLYNIEKEAVKASFEDYRKMGLKDTEIIKILRKTIRFPSRSIFSFIGS